MYVLTGIAVNVVKSIRFHNVSNFQFHHGGGGERVRIGRITSAGNGDDVLVFP